MLVLSRKLGQEICIGDEIEVKVLSIHGNRVKLGFRCPSHIPIHRQELVVTVNADDDVGADREFLCAQDR